jgi:hypothetical protein
MGLLDVLGLQPKTPVATVAGPPGVQSSSGGPPGGSATVNAPPKAGSSGGGVVDAAQKGVFSVARGAAVAQINALKAHPQAAAIQTFIAQANTKLATADGHATKSEWTKAMQALQDVIAIAATAKKAADDRQAFTVKLADITMGMNAFENFDNTTFTALSNAIGNANAQATANNYVAANTTLDAAATTLRAALKGWVDTVNGMLTNSTANASVATFLKPELDKARVQAAAANTALGARRWSEGVMAAVTALRALASTERMAPRRAAYEASRIVTVAKIATVKAIASLADRGPGLDALLADADKSGGRPAMQF